jgi:hypothetical protein
VLIILLPATEMITEVVRYTSLASSRVLFIIESAHFDNQDASSVIQVTEQWAHLIILEVQSLSPGDANRFVRARLECHCAHGTYPRISEEALEELSQFFRTIGVLQRALYEVYDHLRHSEQYDDSILLSLQDIVSSFYGIRPSREEQS